MIYGGVFAGIGVGSLLYCVSLYRKNLKLNAAVISALTCVSLTFAVRNLGTDLLAASMLPDGRVKLLIGLLFPRTMTID